jgi:AraC family transcriptional regulator of arabinose operon
MADNLHNPAAETVSPPPGILVSGHFNEPYGYQVQRANGTRDWLITCTLSGSGVYKLDGASRTCRRGDIAILMPGTPHHYATQLPETRWEFIWAHFVPRPNWSRWLQLPEAAKGSGMIHLHISEDEQFPRIYQAFQRVIADTRGISALAEELALNALEEIVLLLAQKQSINRISALDPRIEEVLQWMALNIAEQHTVADLAKRVCLSPSRLSHIFKEQVGDSIIETMLKMRLRQAARLLEFTTRQVTEIAQDVGFHSLYYFSRQFTGFYGMSPSAFRERTQRR